MRIDAHQHFWNLETGLYPHLAALPEPANRSYGPDELAPRLTESGIDATVLVQAGGHHADTASMLAQARAHDWIAGVVGWLDLLDPRATERSLAAWADEPLLVGMRHQIHDEPDPRWLLQGAVLDSLRLLADAGVPFEVVAVLPEHLELVPRVHELVPGLRLVIDHLAKPPIAARGWEPWATQLARAASIPSVFAKISGLDTAADPTDWSAADLQPYVDHALDVFGARRLMFGADWPVLRIAGEYADVVRATEAVLAGRTRAERAAIWSGTAQAFYGLPALAERAAPPASGARAASPDHAARA